MVIAFKVRKRSSPKSTGRWTCTKATINVPRKSSSCMNKDNTILQHGDEGLLNDVCVIRGGSHQVVISSSATGFENTGVTFVGSSRVSVLGDANSNATTCIRDSCHFSGHPGAVVLLISYHDGEALLSSNKIRSFWMIKTFEGQSIGWELYNCSMSDNSVDLAHVLALGGSLVVSSSIFQA